VNKALIQLVLPAQKSLLSKKTKQRSKLNRQSAVLLKPTTAFLKETKQIEGGVLQPQLAALQDHLANARDTKSCQVWHSTTDVVPGSRAAFMQAKREEAAKPTTTNSNHRCDR